jgi:hypothetical protein
VQFLLFVSSSYLSGCVFVERAMFKAMLQIVRYEERKLWVSG